MPIRKTERAYHPNGQLRWEGTFVDGIPDGVQRCWYENGVLSDECCLKNGHYDGVVKHWNKNGELVGTFEMRNGTGVFKKWYDNGVLSGEISFVNGEMTGRQRCWFEDGELVTSVFWIRGRRVSKKKYKEACIEDPSLPRYDNEPAEQSWETKMKRLQSRRRKNTLPTKSEIPQAIAPELLHDPTKKEARAWLNGTNQKIRTLGEISSQEESLALVDEAYSEKVGELFVIKVQRGDDGLENSGLLLAKLPTNLKKRKRAIAWCNQQNEFQGFEPEEDQGQEWIVVQLD
ncbi:MAG TPA: toxin-antitoxin system YwqK family antitoxin [Verrucomicrobiae bacterium]